jgi:methylated-DNA-[protein]-cysteine S-methyltransferase
MITDFQKRVYECVENVPRGKVVSYAYVARIVKSSPRAVGQALKKNPFAPQVPCHRVVCSNRTLCGFFGSQSSEMLSKKSELLRKEGVMFDKDGKVGDKCFMH